MLKISQVSLIRHSPRGFGKISITKDMMEKDDTYVKKSS